MLNRISSMLVHKYVSRKRRLNHIRDWDRLVEVKSYNPQIKDIDSD